MGLCFNVSFIPLMNEKNKNCIVSKSILLKVLTLRLPNFSCQQIKIAPYLKASEFSVYI